MYSNERKETDMRLADAKAGYTGKVCEISGNLHLLSRLIGIGIVEGSDISVVQNYKGQPILFYCKDSMIALSRKDCEGILLEEEQKI